MSGDLEHRNLPAMSYLHGLDGWDTTVPGRVCAWLEMHCGLREARLLAMGKDNQIYQVLTAMHIAANQWQELASTSVVQREPAEVDGELRKWVTPAEAAELGGITDGAVRLAIREGRLAAEKSDRRWRIRRKDFENWRSER